MNKIKIIIKIAIELLFTIFIYLVTCMFWKQIYNFRFIYFVILILIIIYENFENITNNFFEDKDNTNNLFNTYYINYPKMFEIAMLINNRIKIKVEEFYKREKQNKEIYSIEGSVNPKKIKFGSKLGNELMELSSHEYREFQEIKNTNSIYLREVLKKCRNVDSLNNLENGDLIKIDNVKLKIWNNEEILQANSIISGAFNGNTVDTYSGGQALKINVNSLTNMILKDYKYYLTCTKGKEIFYIDIPMKAEKEFENEYSIYDLEIGLVNIIGIYRTESYDPENKTTYSKLQELGNKQNVEIDEMKSSRETKGIVNPLIKLEKAPYIDLIAIIQDLSFKNGDRENNEK